MKNYKTSILTVLIGALSISVLRAQSFENLDINNINARINANSYLFHNTDNGSSGYEFPANSGINSIFSARLNILGQDVNGQVKGYVPFTGLGGPHAGPVMSPGDYATLGPAWDRVWKINCSTIETFKAWYACSIDANCDASANFPGYQIPQAIIDWPAKGNLLLGQGILEYTAPFFDNDGNDFYDPNAGDHPLIKGNQAIFFIYNTERNQSIIPIQLMEIRGLAYAYGNTGDSALNNTIFIEYETINRSSFTLTETHFGFDVDFDLGNPTDDYIASDVARSAFYAYNGDSNDEDNPGSGTLGYGTNHAAQGVVILNGLFQEVDGLDNPLTSIIQDAIDSAGTPYPNLGYGYGDGIVDNEKLGLTNFLGYSIGGGIFGTPSTILEYYNQVRSIWNDGSQIVWGGNGHSSSGGVVPASHLFSGDSDPLFWSTEGISVTPSDWSELNASAGGLPNSPGDRKGVGSIGPVTQEPGEIERITIALVSARDYSGSGPLIAVDIMKERIDSIHSYYKAGIISECGTSITTSVNNVKEKGSSLSIYPNPFNNQFTLNYQLENNTALVEIYSVVGKKIQTKTITQNASIIDLSTQPNGFYFVTITDGSTKISQKIVKQ